jgi:hypothetical protein
MKVPKTTLILVLTAITLGGIVYVIETTNNNEVNQTETSGKQEKIFDFAENDVVGLMIEKQDQILVFEKTEQPLQPWQMQEPEEEPASDAVISFLLNLLVNGRGDRPFNITPEDQELYGLDNPFGIITITLNNQKTHQLKLGKTSFNDGFIYGTIDNSPETVFLLQIEFKYAIDRELQEWKQE